MNKVLLTGRLTKDGEVRTTSSNLKLYSNSIAVNKRVKNTDGKFDVDFFNFTLWNVADNFVPYLTKGKQVLIEGRIQNRQYENDKKEKRNITEIIAERIELLGGEKKESKEPEEVNEFSTLNTKTNYSDDSSVQVRDEDLPF